MNSNICEWKDSPKNMNHKLHSICTYMAMFPPTLPNHFINKYSNEEDVVLDPFSGRGTTILEACLTNRKSIGNDKNPLAYLLTKSKADIPKKNNIIFKINKLRDKFDEKEFSIVEEERNIKMIFSNYTLKQLIFLKKELNWKKSNVDAFIASLILGIIHGNSEGFLSLSMPNTFSMSPNYVKNYIREHNLKKPKRNVFDLMLKKLDRCYQESDRKGKVFNHDVRNMKKIKDSSVDLIITSPPYTRVIKYGQFNWIRLWFLNENAKSVDQKLFFTQSKEKYSTFMTETLTEMKRVLKPNAKIILVIGDVKDKDDGKPFNLAGFVWKKSAKSLGFKLVEPIRPDVISDDTKVSRIWGAKRGNATKVDRIVVLEK